MSKGAQTLLDLLGPRTAPTAADVPVGASPNGAEGEPAPKRGAPRRGRRGPRRSFSDATAHEDWIAELTARGSPLERWRAIRDGVTSLDLEWRLGLMYVLVRRELVGFRDAYAAAQHRQELRRAVLHRDTGRALREAFEELDDALADARKAIERVKHAEAVVTSRRAHANKVNDGATWARAPRGAAR